MLIVVVAGFHAECEGFVAFVVGMIAVSIGVVAVALFVQRMIVLCMDWENDADAWYELWP